MQIFGSIDCHYYCAVVVQLPHPSPLPIAVTPAPGLLQPHPAVHLSRRRKNASPNPLFQIYELPRPRFRPRRVSRSPTQVTNTVHPPQAPISDTRRGPNNVAKVDIDTPTKELAELSFQLEDKLGQESPVEVRWQVCARRHRRTYSADLGLANASTLSPFDSLLVETPPFITASPEFASDARSPTQEHQHVPGTAETSIQSSSGLPAAGDVLPAGAQGDMQTEVGTPPTIGEAFAAGADATISAWAQTAFAAANRNSLDNEARFSMVMEVLSCEPLHVRHRTFDEDFWSFTSAGAVLHNQTAIAEICQELSVDNHPRREWVFCTLHERAIYRPRRRRGPPRDVTPLGRRELRREAASASEERPTEASQGVLDEAQIEEEGQEPNSQPTQQAALTDQLPNLPVDGASSTASGSADPSPVRQVAPEDSDDRGSVSSSRNSSSVAPAYVPDWFAIGADRLGYDWWFLVDYECNLHWSFSYVDEQGRQVFLPRSEYERLLELRRRTAVSRSGMLSSVREEG